MKISNHVKLKVNQYNNKHIILNLIIIIIVSTMHITDTSSIEDLSGKFILLIILYIILFFSYYLLAKN